MAAVQLPHSVSPLDDAGELYRLIAETIPLMVWTARADGSVDFLNRRVLDYTGRAAQELRGWNWQDVVHPDDWESCLATWTRALQSGERCENEMRLKRADGQYRWHHGSGVPLRDAEGRITRWFGTCTDIEEQFRSAQILEATVAERTRELNAMQRRLREIVENEPECVKILDAQGRLLEMNAAGLRMIEAESAAPLIGRRIEELVAPEHRAAFCALTERVCRGERGTLEFEIIGLKGARRWLESHAVPLREESGKRSQLLSITRDITDRKRAEHALAESEQRFRLFMENIPVVAWLKDSKLRYTYINKRFQTSFQHAPEQVIGKAVAEIYPGELALHFETSDQRVQREGQPIQYVEAPLPGARPGGNWLKVKFPIPEAGGGVGVGGIAIDIGERLRLAAALEESEQKHRTLVELSYDAIVVSQDGRFVYLNPAALALFGAKSPEEMLGRKLRDFILEEFHAMVAGREQRIARGEALPPAEMRLRRVDGGEVWAESTAAPLTFDGRAAAISVIRDLSGRREADEGARRHAQAVTRLLNRLVHAQEQERRRLADDLHDLIGQNLTALGIELSALRASLPADGAQRVAPRLAAMTGLVDGTIESIRGVMTELRPPELEEYGLVPAVHWYASTFGGRTGIRVSTSVAGNVPRLAPEAELALFRIMQEALTNAAKHSGCTSVEITLCEHAGGIRLTAEDDGRGFVNPVGARTERRGGWGLPAMRERAEAHGGTLRIEFPGRGSRLVAEIPGRGD